MNREGKQEIVAELSDTLKDASLVVATDYRGLTVEKITQLRNEPVSYTHLTLPTTSP